MIFLALEKNLIISFTSHWVSAGGGEGLVTALTAPHAGGVDQALVPGGSQGLNCNPEGDVHQ